MKSPLFTGLLATFFTLGFALPPAFDLELRDDSLVKRLANCSDIDDVVIDVHGCTRITTSPYDDECWYCCPQLEATYIDEATSPEPYDDCHIHNPPGCGFRTAIHCGDHDDD